MRTLGETMQLSKSGTRRPPPCVPGGRASVEILRSKISYRSIQDPINFAKRNLYGPERDRTADLLNANQALSQLSYRPKKGSSFDCAQDESRAPSRDSTSTCGRAVLTLAKNYACVMFNVSCVMTGRYITPYTFHITQNSRFNCECGGPNRNFSRRLTRLWRGRYRLANSL